MIKIGNTSFREEAVSKMTLKDFEKTYKGILKGQDPKEVYKQITGKKDDKEAKEDFSNGNDLG